MFGLDDDFDICDTITTQNGIEILEIDNKVKYVGQKIPKKMFYQQGNLSRDDEKIFVDFIDKIDKNVKFLICENNCGIY